MRGDSSRASVIRAWTDNRAAYAETIERIEKRPADELSHTMAKYTFNEYTKAYSASYSAGARIPEMRRDVSAVARVGLLSWQTALIGLTVSQREYFYRFGRDVQYYRNRLWLVSLALALDVDTDVFDEAVGAAEPVWSDRLIGLLIQSRRPDFEVGEEFAFKTLGRGLAKAWDAPDPVKAVESYLAKWPSYYKREGWTDAVLNPDLGDMRYFGLWAFETVGVVKALGLDDTRLLTNEYYPAGILHADL